MSVSCPWWSIRGIFPFIFYVLNLINPCLPHFILPTPNPPRPSISPLLILSLLILTHSLSFPLLNLPTPNSPHPSCSPPLPHPPTPHLPPLPGTVNRRHPVAILWFSASMLPGNMLRCWASNTVRMIAFNQSNESWRLRWYYHHAQPPLYNGIQLAYQGIKGDLIPRIQSVQNIA